MKTLEISKELNLPLDAVTQTFAIMAKRGVGKTHTASVMAEEMLKQGQPIVVYDPTSAWWGLKSSADGKKPGFPIVIFGGEHADVPLEETAGEMIATVIVERRLSAILDCGLMRKGARIRFMTAFCEALYHKNREPIHFFIDEAQTVAPQNLKAMPEIARLVGALEDIILQGRRRGLGVTVISPRPAILNTSIRSACEVLIAMQIVGPHDRKAIQEWIDVHGDDMEAAKAMMASLSSLKRGEAWIWSPAWLELFVRTKFRRRETFDSSATPEVGHRVAAPSRMADIDLEKLGAEIAATVERVKADDPKALRAEITKLRRELAAKPEPKVVKEGPVTIKTIEKPVVGKRAVAGITQAAKEMNKAFAKIRDIHKAWGANLEIVEKRVVDLTAVLDRVTKPTAVASGAPLQVMPRMIPGPDFLNKAQSEMRQAVMESGGQMPRPQLRILQSLAAFEPLGVHQVKKEMLAAHAGASPRSSAYTNNLGRLRGMGLIDYPMDGYACLTDAGRSRAGEVPAIASLAELHESWYRILPRPQADILRALIGTWPNAVGKEELAKIVGASAASSAYTNNLGRLRTLGAISYPFAGMAVAAELLFPEALR